MHREKTETARTSVQEQGGKGQEAGVTYTAGLERLMGVKLPGSDRWLGPGGRNMWPKTGAGKKSQVTDNWDLEYPKSLSV